MPTLFNVRVSNFFFATLIGIIPQIFLAVSIGSGLEKIIDENSFTQVFDDMWLKEYTTQLIKQQWGTNLIKFEGMQLPGGVTLNGQKLYDDATQELIRLREQLRLEHELPVDFFAG